MGEYALSFIHNTSKEKDHFLKVILLILGVWLCVYMHTHVQMPAEARRGIGCPGTGVAHSCESPNMSDETQIPVLCQEQPTLLTHLSNPRKGILIKSSKHHIRCPTYVPMSWVGSLAA